MRGTTKSRKIAARTITIPIGMKTPLFRKDEEGVGEGAVEGNAVDVGLFEGDDVAKPPKA